MEKHYVLGLDIGTTSAKAVLFDRMGMVISEDEINYSLSHPFPGWVEQDPGEIERAAVLAIHNTIEKCPIQSNQIIAVGISAAMHSLICLDKNYQPISPSIIWADGRSYKQAQRLKKEDGLSFYLRTGTPLHPMSPFLKLLWMKENNYEPYQQAAKFISIKEYLLLKWFNKTAADYSIASATGLFNIHSLKWDEKALNLAGIKADQLSEPVAPTTAFEGLNREIAEEMGVEVNLPFIIGGSDGPLANLGIGAIDEQDIAITIGTSGAIRKMTSKPKTDDLQEVFCYAFSDHLWVMGGPTNNGGIVFRWLKEVLGEAETNIALANGEDPYDLLTQVACQSPAGSEGLLFLPFLNGERAPYWDANARGSYIGLNQSHKKEHLLRAGLEGVIYNIYQIAESIERLSGDSNQLLASGGFARSSFWLQILADIFGKEVKVPSSHQSSAWGAAWTALVAMNEVDSFHAIKECIPMNTTYYPDEKNHKLYQQLYMVYKEIYHSLKAQFHTLADIQRQKR